MPNRVIREGYVDSELVDSLSPDSEILFFRLMLVCDDAGRFDGRVSVIASKCWPNRQNIRQQSVEKWIQEVADSGLASRYVVNGKPFIQIMKWARCSRSTFAKFPDSAGGFAISFTSVETKDGVKDFVTTSLPDGIAMGSARGTDGIAMGSSPMLPRPTDTETKTETYTKTETKTGGGGKPPSPPRIPTLPEVIAYCQESKSPIDPEKFFAHYEANGWKQSNGLPIVKWKLAVTTWEKNERSRTGKPQAVSAGVGQVHPDDVKGW